MCFHIRVSSSLDEITQRFNVFIEDNTFSFRGGDFSAFTFPRIPVITNQNKEKLQFFQWGLIPPWSKEEEIKKFTLNARWETLNEKPAFKHIMNNRCLVVVDGFYEWKWLDQKGRKKQKYFITLDNSLKKPFALGGLYSKWINPNTGEIIDTFTIITIQARGIMEEIHNSKKRMPLILREDVEKSWLENQLTDFSDVPLSVEIIK